MPGTSRRLGYRTARVSRKCPIVGGGVGASDDPDVAAQLPDMCDFACVLRLQCDLAALRHAAEASKVFRRSPLASWNETVPQAAVAPGGLERRPSSPVSQRHHDAVERHRGADRLVRYALGVTDAVKRLAAEDLPTRVHGPCQALQAAHRRRHAADLHKERCRCRSGRRSDRSGGDRAEAAGRVR